MSQMTWYTVILGLLGPWSQQPFPHPQTEAPICSRPENPTDSFWHIYVYESQLLLDGEDEYGVWFILPSFGIANFICSLKASVVILFMDPEMVPIYFQTGGESYE